VQFYLIYIKLMQICWMAVVKYYNLNGKILNEFENHLSINNRSFRYGDGFFETMKLVDGQIQLKELHFNRIMYSLEVLGFKVSKHFSFDVFEQQIVELATKNAHRKLSRIRVNFFRQDAELFSIDYKEPHILIQSFQLNTTVKQLNENGLVVGLYSTAKKSCDIFSNIKSNNYLHYIMAAMWAKENKFNDALLLNSNNNIADSCIANIFIIKNSIVKTPALTEACIAGVMRQHIISKLKQNDIEVVETALNSDDVINADEVFLTNVIKGIMWVKQFNDSSYDNIITHKIYNTIFN